jgi:hypothetical protein
VAVQNNLEVDIQAVAVDRMMEKFQECLVQQ